MNRRDFIKALACVSLVPISQGFLSAEIVSTEMMDGDSVPVRAERIEVNVNAGATGEMKKLPEIIITDNLGRKYKFDCKEIEINLTTDFSMNDFLGHRERIERSDALYDEQSYLKDVLKKDKP